MDYRSIIESKYNRAEWQKLLYDIFRQNIKFWQQPSNVVVDEAMAKSALYIGQITLPDGHIIAVYEVELSDKVVIERNRAGIRNLLCTNWRGMGCSGAFMFCYRQKESVLRFSYVSESYVFADDGSLKKESTDTKRFTYLLGEGHRSRTAIDQFEKLKKSNLDLKAVTKAFSVEVLSDSFFKEYKKQYEDIVEFVTGKRMVKVANKWEEKVTGLPCTNIMDEFAAFPDAEKAVRDYVKKLMGRLVFIQFLQKKGWMGCSVGEAWNDGDKEFVQNLFDNTQYKETFVDDVLEPLFNDINTKREGDLASNTNLGENIKIPYLNGGLFENDDYDNTRFPLPAKYMKSMLDFFANYNFTIDENDPDDAEIGVDPEMLGRIFENLLEDNKDKGAFYTPKEIVQYMCRESLIAHLQTDIAEDSVKESIRQFVTTYDASLLDNEHKKMVDQKLKEVKICDPAIGSGAFPMGLLRELYSCRKAIEGINDETAVSIKTHIIQNNIYGVDLEKGAVDIARLRFWLALIVDEKNPHALPNMDFKIMQGNSLLEQYEGVNLSGMSLNQQAKTKSRSKKQAAWQQTFAFDEDDALKNIQNAIKEYYLMNDHATKTQLRNVVNENVRSYILNLKGCTPEIQEKLKNLPIPNNQFFLWHIYFKDVFDKGGFDIVIGNPPYVKEDFNSSAFNRFKEYSPYYMGKMDLWYGFVCHGIDFLKSKGHLCFIAQNNWTTNAGGKKLRNKVLNDTKICQLVDFNNYMVFGESASIQTMIMLFEKCHCELYQFDYRKLYSNCITKKEAMLMLQNCHEVAEILTPSISYKTMKNKLLSFVSDDSNYLLDKIFKDADFLLDKEASNGIHTHFDFVNKKMHEQYKEMNIGDGIFVLSYEELLNLNLSKEEMLLIKPYFTSGETLRYTTKKDNKLWIIYTDSSFKDKNKMQKYPIIKKHLDYYSRVITSDNRPYGLHRARNNSFFTGEKIASLRMCSGKQCFSYSNFDCYLPASYYIIKTERYDMKFLTGLFNSKLIEFWLKKRGKTKGNVLQVDKEPILMLPIKTNGIDDIKISSLVDQIITIKNKNNLVDISSFEKEIDIRTYHLYGLNKDEINQIESSIK